ncbi:ATP-grasp domain-containing protein [Streptomyces sp. NPDC048669]|uniref:ATP-grasp domain-containing protein n=1 Tax=Streptomyces sp. NPDC048669 TaxID=3155267 RepID=UPI003413CAA2
MHILMVECNPNGIAGIANALQLGHDVTFVSADPDFYLGASPLAEAAFAHPKCDVIKSVEAFSIDELERLAKEIHAAKPVHGVTTYSEYHTVHAASVARSLGLPGMSVEGALNARHKHRTRLTLEHTDVRQPRFVAVADPKDMAAAVHEIGFPCVVKPSDGTASLHVLLLRDDQELTDYLADLAKVDDYGRGVTRIPEIVVEEFIEGELVSVEACVLQGGEIVNLGITDRNLSGFPYFIEMGLTYFRGHPLEAELFTMNEKVLKGLGVDFGFIHAEYFLAADGPVLCEVNGRLTGGIVPQLMELSSGVNPYLEVIRQALGERPELPFPGEVIAGGHWFGSPVDGEIVSIGFDRLKGTPGFEEALAYAKPGRTVSRLSKSNFDWLGHLIYTGKDRDEAAGRVRAALDDIEFTITAKVAR